MCLSSNRARILSLIAFTLVVCVPHSTTLAMWPMSLPSQAPARADGTDSVVERPDEQWVWRPGNPLTEEGSDLAVHLRASIDVGNKSVANFVNAFMGGDTDVIGVTETSLSIARKIGRAPGAFDWQLRPSSSEDFIRIDKGQDPFRAGSEWRASPRCECFLRSVDPAAPGINAGLFPMVRVNDKASLEFLGHYWLINASGRGNSRSLQLRVLVIGEVVFPADTWSAVGTGLEIKGGGLSFTTLGISLLPGTHFRRAP